MDNAEAIVAALTGAGKREVAKHDPVENPAHYLNGKIEVIDFLEDQDFGFHEACAVQYICRARFKNDEVQDLQKAIWYLNRKIQLLEKDGCQS